MSKQLLKFCQLAISASIATMVLALVISFLLPTTKTRWQFTPVPINIATYDFFDLGVVDANSDGNLDLFTLNHSATQSFMTGDGTGEFQDVLSAWHLDQDRQFPQLEDSLTQPEFTEPGLYIYRQNKALILHGYRLGDRTISGTLQLPWVTAIEKQEQFESQTQTQTQPSGVETTIEFTASNNGWLVVRGEDDIVEIPHRFELNPQVPLTSIHLGNKPVSPDNHSFDLMWRDRHTMAWTDLNGDGLLDVYIGRGAVKGQIQTVSDRLSDELMLQTPNGFVDRIATSGMSKEACPARQSAWTDFNRDGLLDLYVVCGRNSGAVHPNQLWQQQPNGKFSNVAPELGLDFPEDGCFRWLDADNDGDLDLLITREKIVQLWRNNGDRFKAKTITKGKAKLMNLAIADFDRDGDLDAYASSKRVEEPNLLLLNYEGEFEAVNPQAWGLPNTGISAAWTDYNRDGSVDLHLVPQGIYRQRSDRRFEATNLLSFDSKLRKISDARTVWFDFNNDGAEDYMQVVKQPPPPLSRLKQKLLNADDAQDWQKVWNASLYKNTKLENHWLQIILAGSPENPQGIGAIVKVTTATGEQLQQVGTTDSSYYSQGHYRLYFGLGKSDRIKAIDIKWSDGQTQHLENLKGDRLITIKKTALHPLGMMQID